MKSNVLILFNASDDNRWNKEEIVRKVEGGGGEEEQSTQN